ncbi:hypothetical protein CEE45_01640 [Candidatus Heimdallarchaeota archaeon B3_Heim]|nr:MAG: hypothetical protein CEE45_01640 [Candidatus Heimdallarchaeota archaeon B3_Heim]
MAIILEKSHYKYMSKKSIREHFVKRLNETYTEFTLIQELYYSKYNQRLFRSDEKKILRKMLLEIRRLRATIELNDQNASLRRMVPREKV